MNDEDFSTVARKAQLSIQDVLQLLKWRGLPGEPDEDIRIGDEGLYLITREGIRAEPITDEELSLLAPEHQRDLLEAAHEMRLDIPCTPADLISFVERQASVPENSEFVLPTGFVDAVMLRTPEYRRASTVSAEKRCEAWLHELMRSEEPTVAKHAYAQRAKQEYGVSHRGFERCWAAAISRSGNTGWRRPGRKKKM